MIGASIGPLLVLALFAFMLRYQRRVRNEEIRRLLAGQKLKPDSWHRSVNGEKRHGVTTVAAPALLVLMAGMFLLGAWSRERSYKETLLAGEKDRCRNSLPAGGMPAAIHESNRIDLSASQQFDSRLAELRTDPKAAVHFKYCSIEPSRRAEVIEALRTATQTRDVDLAAVAQAALARWE